MQVQRCYEAQCCDPSALAAACPARRPRSVTRLGNLWNELTDKETELRHYIFWEGDAD